MTSLFRRPRTALPAVALLAAALAVGCGHGTSGGTNAQAAAVPTTATTSAGQSSAGSTDGAFKDLEQHFGARLGVYAVDTGSGREVAYRSDERFAFASTIKSLLTGALLRTASDQELDKVVTYRQDEVLTWAPITSRHVDTGMKVRDLAAADHHDIELVRHPVLLVRRPAPVRARRGPAPGLLRRCCHGSGAPGSVSRLLPGPRCRCSGGGRLPVAS